MILNKKAEGILFAIVVVLVLIIVIGIVIDVGNRECRKDSECGNNEYCGSDFKCHTHPIIEKTIIQRDLVKPAIIIGLAIIIASWIFKGSPKLDLSRFKKKKENIENHDRSEHGKTDHNTPGHETLKQDQTNIPHSVRLP